MDNLLEIPRPQQSTLLSELKYAGEGIASMGAEVVRRGSKRIWEGFWDSPVQQRVTRHMIIIGLAATSFISQTPGPVNTINAPHSSTSATEISAPLTPIQIQPLNQSKSEKVQIPAKSQEDLAEKIFAGLTLEQSEKANEEINKQFKLYQNDQIRIKNTLKWEPTLDLIVKDRRLNIKTEERNFWKQRMLEIIFVESEGNPKASSGIADGLTQLKHSTARETAQRLGILKYDIYNGWDNAFLGLAHQLNLAKRYGPQLAGWTHHLGSGNMDTALKAYLIQNLRLPVKDVEQIFDSSDNLSDNIAKYNITPFVLLNSPAVTGKLKEKGAFEDNTDRYSINLHAAKKAMKLNES